MTKGDKGDKGDQGPPGVTNTSNYLSYQYSGVPTNTTSLGSYSLVGQTGVTYLAIITYDITITSPIDWTLNIRGVKSEQSIAYLGSTPNIKDQIILIASSGSTINLSSSTSKTCTGNVYMSFVPMSS